MSAPPWVASPLLLPPVLPCLLLFLPPPALRAVLWARQPDRHGEPVLLRQQGEWRRLRRLHLPHRLWAQLHGLQRAQRLFRFLLLHYPVIGPGHGWRDTRQAAQRGTPKTSRLLRTRRRVSQSVSRRRLLCSMEEGNLREKEMSTNQLVLVSEETRTVLTASFLKTPKLRKWSIDQGNLRSEIAQMHRLGLYLKNRDRWFSKNIARKLVITNSKQLMQKKNAEFYEKNYGVSKRIFVKFINKIKQRWRNYENSKVLPSIRLQDESSSRTRTLFWNYQAENKNYKMKYIVWTILRTSRMLNQFAVEIPTLPVDQCLSHLIRYLKDCWGILWYRRAAKKGRQAFGTHMVYRETFFANPHASSSAPYPQELNQWRTSIEEPLHTSTAERKVKDQNKIEIWDASLDRQPEIHSTLVRERFSKNYGANQQRLQISDPYTSNVCLVEDKVHDWGMYLLIISYGSCAVDQRSGDGWISGWSQIFVFY